MLPIVLKRLDELKRDGPVPPQDDPRDTPVEPFLDETYSASVSLFQRLADKAKNAGKEIEAPSGIGLYSDGGLTAVWNNWSLYLSIDQDEIHINVMRRNAPGAVFQLVSDVTRHELNEQGFEAAAHRLFGILSA